MFDADDHSPIEVLDAVLPFFREEFGICPVSPDHCFLNGPLLVLHRRDCTCASDHSILFTVASLVVHLNDDHKWSREAVADWLESLDVDLSFPLVD